MGLVNAMEQGATRTLGQMYQLAQQELLILEQPQPVLLHVRGHDGLDLINRMSTNDLGANSSREPITTVFTNANARIVDIATVLPGEEDLLLLCWQDSPTTLANWLAGYIFFQDDVHLEPARDGWRLIDFIGPQSRSILTRSIRQAKHDDHGQSGLNTGHIWSQPLGRLERVRLLCQGAWENSIQSPTDLPLPVQSKEINELLRIESGIPSFGAEIQENTIPLEVGLWENISFSKGCYIGQEIIARMESRGKLAKTLVGLQSEQRLHAGSTLHADGRTIGQITSSALSPRHGEIGLAIVKTSGIQSATSIRTIADHRIQIRELPLP